MALLAFAHGNPKAQPRFCNGDRLHYENFTLENPYQAISLSVDNCFQLLATPREMAYVDFANSTHRTGAYGAPHIMPSVMAPDDGQMLRADHAFGNPQGVSTYSGVTFGQYAAPANTVASASAMSPSPSFTTSASSSLSSHSAAHIPYLVTEGCYPLT